MLKHISDDHLISYASSIITIANNIGRVMWMIFLDYTNFKTLVVVINLAVATLLFTIPMIWSNTTLLITWMSGIWLFGSGLYPSFIVETYRIFPGDSGKKAYPILTLPWTLAIFSMNGVTAIGDWYGYTYVMYILILCSLGSIILVLIFPAKIEKSVKEVDLIDELILEDKDVSINP